MTATDMWCAICVRRIHDKDKDFKEEMPRRAVTQINGTPCCADCSSEIDGTIDELVPLSLAANVARGYEKDLQAAYAENDRLRAIIDRSIAEAK